MTLKRAFNQVSSSPQILSSVPKRLKHGVDSLSTSQHPASLADLLPQTHDQVHTSATMASYDFTEFGTPQTPHVPDSQDATAYPFLEFLGNGSEFTPTAAHSHHLHHHAMVGSSASSTVGSAAASPVQGLAPMVATAMPMHAQNGNRPVQIYQNLRHPQPHQQANLPPSMLRPQSASGVAPVKQENTVNIATSDTAAGAQGPRVVQQQSHSDSEPTSPGQEAVSSDTTAVEDSESSRRAADRAARNRESSRRAREKAKGRLKALESDNHALREITRRQRMQIESMALQIQQLQRGSCNMCGYGISNVGPSAPHQHAYPQDHQSAAVPQRR